MSSDRDLTFCTIATPGSSSEVNSLILAESLRKNGGKLSESTVVCFFPDLEKEFHPKWVSEMQDMAVRLVPFDIKPEQTKKWFIGHSLAASKAEKLLIDETSEIAWFNPNTVIMQEPSELILQKDKSLGYRPVHHALIGSRYGEPLDEYWSLVYDICNVPEERIFPMKTHVEETLVRPYFNAGFLVVRPEVGILSKWSDVLIKSYDHPRLTKMYAQNQRYEIFIHQAILSGVILNRLEPEEMTELSALYNYPVHLHGEDETAERPTSMDDTIAFRHEGFYAHENWRDEFPASQQLIQWLSDTLKLVTSWKER
jgi:hypothetical protein